MKKITHIVFEEKSKLKKPHFIHSILQTGFIAFNIVMICIYGMNHLGDLLIEESTENPPSLTEMASISRPPFPTKAKSEIAQYYKDLSLPVPFSTTLK